MIFDEFKNLVIENAKKLGITEYDLLCSSGVSTSIFAFNGEIDSYSDQTTIGVGFRCIVNGKIGSSHTQLLNEDEAMRIVRDAKDSSEIIGSEDFVEIFAGSDKYTEIPKPKDIPCDVKLLKQTALDIENYCKNADNRVVSVPYSVAEYSKGETALFNCHGLDLKSDGTYYVAVCQVVLEEDGRKYIGTKSQIKNTQSELDPKYIAEEAVKKAVKTIGGSSVKSGEYPVVFQNDMMSSVFEAFAGVFSADAAQKGLSLLDGKEGEQIAAPIVTLADDPLYPESPIKFAFDGEGVATYTKNIIENGILKTLVYDLKSAKKAGKSSTGNGRRGSYSSPVGVGVYNLVMKPGELSYDDLIKKADNGVLITELKGLHSSSDSTSGDFSLEAKGFVIENGKISRPAELFTVAGNFFDLMKNIDGISNDSVMDDSMNVFPSVLVSKLSVAGENN